MKLNAVNHQANIKYVKYLIIWYKQWGDSVIKTFIDSVDNKEKESLGGYWNKKLETQYSYKHYVVTLVFQPARWGFREQKWRSYVVFFLIQSVTDGDKHLELKRLFWSLAMSFTVKRCRSFCNVNIKIRLSGIYSFTRNNTFQKTWIG